MSGKILFLTSPLEDYLSDGLFHGLRTLLGSRVVDYPKAERMYRAPREKIEQLRGHGCTLYGLLEDIEVNRPSRLNTEIASSYEVVIVSDIWRQWMTYASIAKVLAKENAIILDGADAESLYKYAEFFWRNPKRWFLPKIKSIPYFKRELTPRTLKYRCFLLAPEWLISKAMHFAPWHKTSFSIPNEKVLSTLPPKKKLMAAHIVDPEVAQYFGGSTTGYAFSSEEEYYKDLQTSRFAITSKRGGWDCLRHYEIAANGCVPCFRSLDRKPETCAPHGLSRENCIVYENVADLKSQINSITDRSYAQLQQNALGWAKANTTTERAKEVLQVSEHEDLLRGE